jgi:hypothetical protein
MATAPIQEREDKFRELLLYMAYRSVDDPSFGATKLNRLLWVADFLSYGKLGQPITGVQYVKRQYGPAPRRLPAIRDDMVAKQELAVAVREVHGLTQKRPVPLREPNLSCFTPQEVALIEFVIESLRRANATEVSEWSHGLCGWAIAEDDATIPYETVFLSDRKLTAYEAERGRQLALEREWDVF